MLTLLLVLLIANTTEARQYKSKLFEDSNQDLSSAESLSINQLEAQLATASDPWQIALSGQQLAHQYVLKQEFAKAAEAYQTALAANALAAPVARQLRLEYAQVLLQLKRFAQIKPLLSSVTNEAELSSQERVLLARAAVGLEQFHEVVAQLSPLLVQLASLSDDELKQLAQLSYAAKAWPMTIDFLSEYLQRHPQEPAINRQLTGLYILTEQYDAALQLWSLANSQKLFSQEQDWLLLVDLYKRQNMPDKAARILNDALQQGNILDSAEHWYQLFQLWYQARELASARGSLAQSLVRSNDVQRALLLTELYQQAEQWQASLDTLTQTCEQILEERYVGKANLLLGIAYHKLAQPEKARRAFINATLLSGEKVKAREWLAFIAAAPASREESQQLQGLCLPADTQIALPDSSSKPAVGSSSKSAVADTAENTAQQSMPLTKKRLAATRFYGTKVSTTKAELQTVIKKRTFGLIKALMRSGGSVNGNMHLLMQQMQTGNELNITIAFPFSGAPRNSGIHRIVNVPSQHAVIKQYQGPAAELEAQWTMLVMQAMQEGHQLTGQSRMIFLSDTSGSDMVDVELQLIIAE
ncbi:hypothetical protein MACH26_40190 [Planctobacterium marinum]|uniref:Uncharacterized protein n=1 Tax=Planctobacterium marinum TaxID=1631968 RepID=A0AA48HKH3_9ALTE|nr:hypothetical protein MACH26_40190 [Planctobacterium marinum]